MPFVQTNPIQMADNKANAFVIREKVGGVNYVEIDTFNGSEVTRIHRVGQGNVEFFNESPEGVTKYVGISGYKTSGSLAEARFGVGVHTDEVLSIYNCAGYYFDNPVSIGTATQVGKLTVYGSGETGDIRIGITSATDFRMYRDNALGDLTFRGSQASFSHYSFKSGGGVTRFRIMDNGKVGIGVTPAQKFEIGSNDNSQRISIYHDNNDAWISVTGGFVTVTTTEGTNTNMAFRVKGNGSGKGFFEAYDEDNSEYMEMTCSDGKGRLGVLGNSPGALWLQRTAHAAVLIFPSAAEGQTPYLGIYGYKTSGTYSHLRIAVGQYVDNIASYYNVNGHHFEIADNVSTVFKIAEGGNIYFSINSNTGSRQMNYGVNSATRHSFDMYTSDALAFRIGVDTQDWFVIDTSTPKIEIGNTAANPNYVFLGDGNITGHHVLDTSVPPNPVAGSCYYDDTGAGGTFYIYDGAAWDYQAFSPP